jgi:hypothetical protein
MNFEDQQLPDIIETEDENGRPLTLEVLRYFFYNGQEYALLCNEKERGEQYIMSIQAEDDEETFEPVDEELQAALIQFLQAPPEE